MQNFFSQLSRQAWFTAINMECRIQETYLCEQHFSKGQFVNTRLGREAVPDKKLSPMSDLDHKAATPSTITTITSPNKLVLLLTDEQLKNYVGPDQSIKYVTEGNTVKLLKNSTKPEPTKPKMLTYHEFLKMQTPQKKLPTTSKPTSPSPTNDEGGWKAQAEILRKTVKKKFKIQSESKKSRQVEDNSPKVRTAIISLSAKENKLPILKNNISIPSTLQTEVVPLQSANNLILVNVHDNKGKENVKR